MKRRTSYCQLPKVIIISSYFPRTHAHINSFAGTLLSGKWTRFQNPVGSCQAALPMKQRAFDRYSPPSRIRVGDKRGGHVKSNHKDKTFCAGE